MKRLWLRMIYHVYTRSSRWTWIISRRIRPFGWGLSLFILLTAILGTDVLRSATHIFFCACVAIWLVAFLWFFTRRARLSVVRHLPSFATVGEGFHYSTLVTNLGRRTARSFLLQEWPKNPKPSFDQFANTPEPGEEMRNPVDRCLLYYRWTYLCETQMDFEPLNAKSVRTIASGETASFRFKMQPHARGMVTLANLRILLPDPFGLFQRCRFAKQTSDQIAVLPRRYPLPDFDFPGQNRYHSGETSVDNLSGQGGDFLRFRDYIPGDSPRSIAWKTWDRTGQIIVQEFEESFSSQNTIIFDTTGKRGACFEEALSVLSSFLFQNANRSLRLTQLIFPNLHFQLHEDGTPTIRLLQTLASIDPQPVSALNDLAEMMERHLTAVSHHLFILSHWTQEHENFLAQLEKQGLLYTALLVVEDDSDKNLPSHPQIHLLQVSDIERGLRRFADNYQPSFA